MSPLVEGLRTQETIKTPYFIVDLTNPEPFDIQRFEEMCEALGNKSLNKFVVQLDRMFVFPYWQEHGNFYSFVEMGDAQCAGRIEIHKSDNGQPERTILDYSMSLSMNKKLSREKSEGYKHTVLAEKLGRHFEIK